MSLQVNTVEDFWRWAINKLAPGLRAQRWYNDFAPIDQRGFLGDRNSRIIGFATMRQVRTKADGCFVPQPMNLNVSRCYYGSYQNEDSSNYGFKWKSSEEQYPEFSYRPADALGMATTYGQVDIHF